MTPNLNLNLDQAAHITALLNQVQIDIALMYEVAKEEQAANKERGLQLDKSLKKSDLASKALIELTAQFEDRVSGATAAGAKRAVASFSTEATSAALKASQIAANHLADTTKALRAEADDFWHRKLWLIGSFAVVILIVFVAVITIVK
jgi:hypothetical protein